MCPVGKEDIPVPPEGNETAGKPFFYVAPMHGITERVWRNAMAAHFRMPDAAVAPFIATFAGERVKPRLLEDVSPEKEQRIPLVPQALGKDPAELRVLLRAFKALGYARADLNAGCPWPMVAKKGRGAGLPRNPDTFRRMLEAGCDAMPGGFSVKVRLGYDAPDQLAAWMPMLNEFPLCEVTIHARTAKQMYAGEVDLEAFADAAARCRHPVVYNGDLFSLEEYRRLQARFPGVSRWMLGRGLLRDPFLMEDLAAGCRVPRDAERLAAFLEAYLDATLARH
ncbi:MAG: tRNA-dihydrouridine synthase family protein, partial [Kiritimatiellae bacterium]|nr:tRNA-dihydrouridine synthase family protein [Kiritimatiellia bacterium]